MMQEMSGAKKEREYTFLLSPNEIKKFFQILIENRKSIIISGMPFALEKGRRSNEIQLLSSDKFSATRTHDGTRHRIKVKLEKQREIYIYSKKYFLDGERKEENLNLGSDISKLNHILQIMPIVDCVLVKQSIKYRCTNHSNGKNIILRIDACYASDPQSGTINISLPFYCFEIEESVGISLEEFAQSDFFIEKIKPLLHNMPYSSHNRIRLCKEIWPNRELDTSKVEKVIKKIKESFNSYIETNMFAELQNIYLRGDKEIERGSKTEVEYKFVTPQSIPVIVANIRENLPTSYSLIKTSPRIITDVYFDDNFNLLKSNAQFRVRKRKKGDGWIACFKDNPNDTEITLIRDKTRSMVTDKEMIDFYCNKIPFSGHAYEIVKEYMVNKFQRDTENLRPVVLLNQYRDRYTLRYRREKLSSGKFDGYSYAMSDLLHIIFDTVEVVDLRTFSEDELHYFLEQGELDVTEANFSSSLFTSAEIEPNLRADVSKQSIILFEEVVDTLKHNCMAVERKKNKYELGIEYLLMARKL